MILLELILNQLVFVSKLWAIELTHILCLLYIVIKVLTFLFALYERHINDIT